MKYEEFVLRWKESSFESRRIDNSHPLDFYLSKDFDNNYKLLFIAGKKKIDIKDSDVIKVGIGRRKDDRIAYSFVLVDKNFTNQFFRLCFDLIDSSSKCTNNDSCCNSVIYLFIKWQKMMKSSNKKILSQEEVKGLIAELIILDSELYGKQCEEVMKAWSGPKGYYQDFIFSDLWFEVKAISKRSEKITISSIEQLDVSSDGKLITVMLDKIDNEVNESITLNKLIKIIEEKIKHNINLIDEFREKLNLLGYVYTDEYDKMIFKIGNIKEYLVNDDFPRIRRTEIRSEIGKVKYEIILSTIKDWYMGERVWNYMNLERIS